MPQCAAPSSSSEPKVKSCANAAKSPTASSAAGAAYSGERRCSRGHGLLIRPTWSVHTAFMRFAIDVVFLDAELTVLKLARNLRPWRAASRLRAHSVLELAAGECDRLGIGVGDRLAWASLDPAR